MSDNFPLTPGAGRNAATDQVTHSGDSADVQLIRPVLVTGSEGSKTVVDLTGDNTNGLDVDVTRLPALVAGTANIGDVDVLTVPAPLSTTGGGTQATALRVTVASDSTGVLAVTDNSGSLTVDAPTATPLAVRFSDGTNNQSVSAFPAGFLRVTDEPRQLFYDPFDAALDTTNRWNAATAAGGGVAAAISAGTLTIGSGTTANGYSHLSSQPTFVPTIPAWLGASFAISIESAVGNNALRFWGMGTVPGAPTTAAPLTDAYGFELTTAGVLKAVIYAAGVRTEVADLASVQPSDAANHRYIVYYRTDRVYWYIDSLATPAATSNFQSPTVQTLPVRFLSVAHSSGPAASRVITCTGLAVWDTGKNNTQLSDGTYPWRKVSISSAGRMSVDASGVAVPVTDNSSSLTVDAPVATPVFVRLSDGAAAISTLPVSLATVPSHAVVDAGDVAHDGLDSGNPVKVGFKAANALPTAVSNADRSNGVSDLFGRQLTAHIDPAMFVSKSFNATSTQAGTDVWTPAAGKRIAVTSVVIGTYGTTAGRVILWFGDNADTTYTAGTDQLLLAFSTAPSATSKPGLVFTPNTPVFCTTADRELHITTDAAVSIDIAVHGYEY